MFDRLQPTRSRRPGYVSHLLIGLTLLIVGCSEPESLTGPTRLVQSEAPRPDHGGTHRRLPRPAKFSAIEAGSNHTCGRISTGRAFCWGNNAKGQLGDGTQVYRSLPVTVAQYHSYSDISLGHQHTCGISSKAAYCWGNNANGEYGNGTTATLAVPIAQGQSTTYAQITAGYEHTCGRTTGYRVVCWGQGGYGQLGNGTTGIGLVPQSLIGNYFFTDVDAGRWHTCAIDFDSHAYCWGRNASGQLGIAVTVNTDKPHGVWASGEKFTTISAGADHTCAISTNGRAFCWGANTSGQLGNGAGGPGAYSGLPIQVKSPYFFKSISAGDSFTCAITMYDEAYCWGSNASGRLGNGTGTDSNIPVPILGSPAVQQVTAGGSHACALRTQGEALCWGSGTDGQLGNGQASSSPTPVTVLWSL